MRATGRSGYSSPEDLARLVHLEEVRVAAGRRQVEAARHAAQLDMIERSWPRPVQAAARLGPQIGA